MSEFVNFECVDGIATVTLDDGKVNALSPEMQDAIRAALARAAEEQAVTLLRGNGRAFSAGFDLTTLSAGGSRAEAMLRGGFDLAITLLSHPQPLIIECTGHAMAMGVFLLQCGDYRIGSTGSYRVTANEVAIGMTMPHAAIEILRQRLTPAALSRAVVLAEVFSPEQAVAAGFLDRVVEPERLHEEAMGVARQVAALDRRAHAASKQRLRRPVVEAIERALLDDAETFRRVGSS